jgi:hypothetical protein
MISLPESMLLVVIEDAARRDRATARRACLLNILWQERYISRLGLIARVEVKLGKGCFGVNAWMDNFYRDMRVVKRACAAVGFDLSYSRTPARKGYYLHGQGALHPQLARIITGSVAEVDPNQIAIYCQLTPGERFQQGCSISNTARQAVASRLQQRNPQLSGVAALRQAAATGNPQ